MLAFWGSRFQYFLAVSLKDGAECAQIALWILEAFITDFSAELSGAVSLEVAGLASRLPPASGSRVGVFANSSR